MTKHSELISRLEDAEEGSYLLDTAVGKAFGYHVPDMAWAGWHDMDGKHVGMVPAFTTSLDAALALAKRVLPDVRWRVEKEGVGAFWCRIWTTDYATYTNAKTPALSLCIAILRALDL